MRDTRGQPKPKEVRTKGFTKGEGQKLEKRKDLGIRRDHRQPRGVRKGLYGEIHLKVIKREGK